MTRPLELCIHAAKRLQGLPATIIMYNNDHEWFPWVARVFLGRSLDATIETYRHYIA